VLNSLVRKLFLKKIFSQDASIEIRIAPKKEVVVRRLILLLSLTALLLLATAPVLAQSNIIHVVAPGENLFRISLRYNTSMYAIAAANNLYNLNYVYTGQRLIIPTGGYSPAPVPVPQPSGQVYIVRPGDTLGTIAARFGTTIQAIAAANGISNPSFIFTGQRLTVPFGTGGPYTPQPGGQVYVVRVADTLGTIAQRYGTSVQAIVAANGIVNPRYIYPGQRLIIPYGTGGTYNPPLQGRATYVVGSGDTLGTIAARFGTTIQAIAAANGIGNPSLIYPGQQLVIPLR
jgi:LysM repeat protein